MRFDLTTRCPRCMLRPQLCLCAEIPRVETRTRIVIVQHASEMYRTSNSARLAARAILGCELLICGAPGAPLDESRLVFPEARLLLPGGPVHRGEPVPTLVVVDGSWRQARRMSQRIPALRVLPRVALPPAAVAPERLRRQNRDDGMATLEAIANAIELLEGEARAAPLHALYKLFVSRTLAPYGGRGRLG